MGVLILALLAVGGLAAVAVAGAQLCALLVLATTRGVAWLAYHALRLGRRPSARAHQRALRRNLDDPGSYRP